MRFTMASICLANSCGTRSCEAGRIAFRFRPAERDGAPFTTRCALRRSFYWRFAMEQRCCRLTLRRAGRGAAAARLPGISRRPVSRARPLITINTIPVVSGRAMAVRRRFVLLRRRSSAGISFCYIFVISMIRYVLLAHAINSAATAL